MILLFKYDGIFLVSAELSDNELYLIMKKYNIIFYWMNYFSIIKISLGQAVLTIIDKVLVTII